MSRTNDVTNIDLVNEFTYLNFKTCRNTPQSVYQSQIFVTQCFNGIFLFAISVFFNLHLLMHLENSKLLSQRVVGSNINLSTVQTYITLPVDTYVSSRIK